MLPGMNPSGRSGTPPPYRPQQGDSASGSGATSRRRSNSVGSGSGVHGGESSPAMALSGGECLPEGLNLVAGNMEPSPPITSGRESLNEPGEGQRIHLSDPWGLQARAILQPVRERGRQTGQRPTHDDPNTDWEPESWLGRAALNTAAVVALPVVMGMRLADQLPWAFKAVLCFGLLKTAFGLNRGVPVKDKRTPVVQIFKEEPDDNTRGIMCTGTMLDDNTVLTAQHCVLNTVAHNILMGEPCNDTEASGSGSGEVDTSDMFFDTEGTEGEDEFVDDYGDYEACGQYNDTYITGSVAEPRQFYVLTGLTNDTLEYETVVQVIPRSGYNISDTTTMHRDLAILKLNGTGFASKGLHYPRFQTNEEHRQMRTNLNNRDKVWRQNTRNYERFTAEWAEYKKNNETGPEPTMQPKQFNDPNMKAVGWGGYKSSAMLKKEANGEAIDITELGNIEDSICLRKGQVGVRGHRDQKSDPQTSEEQKMCDKELLCQETIRTQKGLTSGLCAGDSGGPLFHKPRGDGKDKQEIIVGVASRGGCGFGGQWVDIKRHDKWIRKNMNQPDPNDPGEGTSGTQQARARTTVAAQQQQHPAPSQPTQQPAQQPVPQQPAQPTQQASSPASPFLAPRTTPFRKATAKTKHSADSNR